MPSRTLIYSGSFLVGLAALAAGGYAALFHGERVLDDAAVWGNVLPKQRLETATYHVRLEQGEFRFEVPRPVLAQSITPAGLRAPGYGESAFTLALQWPGLDPCDSRSTCALTDGKAIRVTFPHPFSDDRYYINMLKPGAAPAVFPAPASDIDGFALRVTDSNGTAGEWTSQSRLYTALETTSPVEAIQCYVLRHQESEGGLCEMRVMWREDVAVKVDFAAGHRRDALTIAASVRTLLHQYERAATAP